MPTTIFDWDRFRQLPIVGILRGFSGEETQRAAEAAIGAGLGNLEVTMNTIGAVAMIASLRATVGSNANIGAGTIRSRAELEAALSAGAAFIVTPTFVPAVLRECRQRQVPVFSGALTPSEMFEAFELGAAAVKVFPSEVFGTHYLRSLLDTFPSWKLMPTGGVTIESLPAYYQAGAVAFGIGGPLFDRSKVLAGDWLWISQQVHGFAAAFRTAQRLNASSHREVGLAWAN